jgi:hypothetical protein
LSKSDVLLQLPKIHASQIQKKELKAEISEYDLDMILYEEKKNIGSNCKARKSMNCEPKYMHQRSLHIHRKLEYSIVGSK